MMPVSANKSRSKKAKEPRRFTGVTRLVEIIVTYENIGDPFK